VLCPSMFFHLISFDNMDETTSLKLKVVALLPLTIPSPRNG